MWLVAAVSPRRSGFDPRLALLKELAMGKVFLVSTSVVPCPYHFTDSPNSFMSTGCSYLTKYRGSLGGKKKNALSEIGEHWTEKYFNSRVMGYHYVHVIRYYSIHDYRY
jgi:hypothetical protein